VHSEIAAIFSFRILFLLTFVSDFQITLLTKTVIYTTPHINAVAHRPTKSL